MRPTWKLCLFIFPFLWKWNGTFLIWPPLCICREDYVSFLWPLLQWRWKGGRWTFRSFSPLCIWREDYRSFLWPLLQWRKKGERWKFTSFPFYHINDRGYSYFLWPLVHRWPDYDGLNYLVFPLLSWRSSAEHPRLVVFPQPFYWRWFLVFPGLFYWARDGQEVTWRLCPIAGCKRGAGASWAFLLAPPIVWLRRGDEVTWWTPLVGWKSGRDSCWFNILGPTYFGSWGKSADESSTWVLFPLFRYGRSKAHSYFHFLPFLIIEWLAEGATTWWGFLVALRWRLFVAARYLFSRGITYLATFSVLASVAVFVLTMGVLEGFAEHLKKTIRANSSHIDVSMPYVDGIQDYASLGASIERTKHVVGWTPYVRGPTLIQSTRYRFYGFVKGIDLDREKRYGGIGPYMRIPRSLSELCRLSELGEDEAREALGRLLSDEALEAVERSRAYALKAAPEATETEAEAFVVEMLDEQTVKMRDLLWDGVDFFALGKEEIEGALGRLIEEGVVEETDETLYAAGPRCELRYRGGSPEGKLLRTALSPPESLEPRRDAEIVLPVAVVGEKIWEELELLPGDAVAFDVQSTEGASTMHFEILGYFRTGSLLFDHWTLVKLEEAMKLFHTRNGITGLGVWLENYRQAYPVKKELVKRLRRYRIRTWWDQQTNLFSGMAIENRIMRIILVGFIGLIGIFVGVILWVMVDEKVRDIGLLVALGSTRSSVTSIFVIDGLLIGIVGTSLGLLAGVGLTLRVNEICDLLGWQPFPEMIFRVPRIPVRLVPFDLALVSGVAVLVSFLASVIPAMKAARMDPVECLRHEA